MTSTATSATVSWDEIPCADRNGNIMAYSYRLYSGSNTATPIKAAETMMTSVSITGLTRGTSYAFSVAARTELGDGTFSDVVNFSTTMSSK